MEVGGHFTFSVYPVLVLMYLLFSSFTKNSVSNSLTQRISGKPKSLVDETPVQSSKAIVDLADSTNQGGLKAEASVSSGADNTKQGYTVVNNEASLRSPQRTRVAFREPRSEPRPAKQRKLVRFISEDSSWHPFNYYRLHLVL